MSSAVEFQGVWKQYHAGLRHQRLSDVVQRLLKGMWARRGLSEGDKGTFWALRDVSFSVRQGETLGIVGRNGSGKSTILKLLAGITTPTKGRTRVRGKVASLIELGAGFHPDLTGRENVFLNGTILGLKRQEIQVLFDQIVAFAEAEPFLDTPVKRYSSGMHVRLGFAIAAHMNTEVLLIDEALSVGDLSFRQKCLQRIHQLKRRGTSMVFVSQNINAIQQISDRAILLERGGVSREGEVGDVVRSYLEEVAAGERERLTNAQPDLDGSDMGEVRIETVRLRDHDGRLTETVEMGRPLTVEVAYTSARRIEHPTVRISIHRVGGLVCHVATLPDGGVAAFHEGRGMLQLRYRAMHLLPNSYWVSVEIGERRGPPLHDSRSHAAFFTVRSTCREDGVAHLEYQWEHGEHGRPVLDHR